MYAVSTKQTTLIRRISDFVRSGRGPDFFAQKERGRGDCCTV